MSLHFAIHANNYSFRKMLLQIQFVWWKHDEENERDSRESFKLKCSPFTSDSGWCPVKAFGVFGNNVEVLKSGARSQSRWPTGTALLPGSCCGIWATVCEHPSVFAGHGARSLISIIYYPPSVPQGLALRGKDGRTCDVPLCLWRNDTKQTQWTDCIMSLVIWGQHD